MIKKLIKYINPEEPLDKGLDTRKWINKNDILDFYPDQPERSKREDIGIFMEMTDDKYDSIPSSYDFQ
jgi:hypothetical protein